MAVQPSGSLYGLNESLSPTDQEIFSIYLQYPDTNSETDLLDTGSPGQRYPEQNDAPSLTSPPAVEYIQRSGSVTEIQGLSASITSQKSCTEDCHVYQPSTDCIWDLFMQQIEHSDLPQNCLEYYSSLAEAMVALNTYHLSTTRFDGLHDMANLKFWLLQNISYSCDQALLQAEGVRHLTDLTAFRVIPDSTQIWSTYSQRAKLITKHVALPSKQEMNLVKCLTTLNASCINTTRARKRSSTPRDMAEEDLFVIINDKLTAWLQYYKKWSYGMQELRLQYMLPLVEQFANDPIAQEEYTDFQIRISKMRAALEQGLPDTVKLTEQLVKNLNLSARRSGPTARLKRTGTRYKREHTL